MLLNKYFSSLQESRKQDDSLETMMNGDNNDLDLSIRDESVLDMDPELQMELDRIELEKLKLQQAQLQCKERLLMRQAERRAMVQAAPVSRCLMPGGKVVVRSGIQGTTNNDIDVDVVGGGGDSLTIPGLQPTASRLCTACGRAADAFCARCGITPYCSAACQRRDWADRHRDVCHNLARSAVPVVPKVDVDLTPPAPLRRPRSPAKQAPVQHSTQQRNVAVMQEHNDDDSDRANPRQNEAQGQQKNNRISNNRSGGNRNQNENRNNRFNRKPVQQQASEENEEWGTPVPQKSAEKPRTPTNAAKPVQTASPSFKPPQQSPKPVETTAKPVETKSKPVEPQPKVKPPVSVDETTTMMLPSRKMVPKTYLIETLSLGEEVIISVDNKAADCRAGADGFVCLTLHSSAEENYQKLCDDYAAACTSNGIAVTPSPGEIFSYLDSADGAWYRARCLSKTTAALLDCGRIVKLDGATCKPLPAPYDAIPEFCCLLIANVKLGDSLKAVLKSKLPRGFEVSLENVETGKDVGRGEVCRWVPQVEVVANVTTPNATVAIPEVDRPPLQNKSEVFIIDATAADRVMVALADVTSQRSFNEALQKTLVFAATAKPLKTPPTKGQEVISKFTDGLHYRALVKRTNVKQNKYLLEYIEYGNTHISPLEELYPCPPELTTSSLPTVTSAAKLLVKCDPTLTKDAQAYIERIKETTELLLTLPDGSQTAPCGSEVILTIVKSKENVNRMIEELCTPQWKKIEETGGDVVEVEPIMFSSVEYIPLPSNGCVLEVLDLSLLTEGSVSAYPRGNSHADYVFNTLTKKMEAYCNSEIGKDPYLPKDEELCIAQCPPYPQWFRAVLVERVGDPGSDEMRVLYIDYGNMEQVSAKLLRKMLPEFVKGLPALVCSVDINDFPKPPTEAQLAKAIEVMQVNDEGRGVLKVTRCVPGSEPGLYTVDAPELIAAMRSV